ncbi:nuclear transport factor 2 family protein [Devosia sp. SL43]|uniref:nuclear transport factor 2 family protein n=1 Tax=Devosia sp. SL43 TaxID=2806348 RepID=UPI001F15A614|nr:DUF4440 domain-containing protein [Devosia sp. SL43]UJW87097.1 DUF4440 domain-containing protein [Devosia sp. SL43]
MDANDIERFRALEQALHRPEVRASRAAVEALLDEGFMEFGSSGRVYDRASVIERLPREKPRADADLPEVLDFEARALAPDIVLVTYRSVSVVSDGTERSVLRSSIWRQGGDDWRMVFHQGTIVSTG